MFNTLLVFSSPLFLHSALFSSVSRNERVRPFTMPTSTTSWARDGPVHVRLSTDRTRTDQATYRLILQRKQQEKREKFTDAVGNGVRALHRHRLCVCTADGAPVIGAL